MALLNTTDDLLTSVKLACFSPARQTTITDANILLMASEELQAIVGPLVKDAHEAYFATSLDYTLSDYSTGVFDVPSRAMGSGLSRVMLVNTDGSLTNVPPTRLGQPETLGQNAFPSFQPVYYMSANQITLVPFPVQQPTLRLIYYPRPGDLVLYSTSCATVETIGGSSFTISQAIPGLATGVEFDVIDKNSPYKYKHMDQTGTVAATTITMTPPSTMAVGDVISLSQTSGIPQIPYDLHALLRYRTAVRVMEALGDMNGMQAMERRVSETAQHAMALIEPRIDSQSTKIVPNQTPFRSGLRRGWWRRW